MSKDIREGHILALQLMQPKSLGTESSQAASNETLEQSVRQIDVQIEQLQKSLDSGREFLNEFAGLSPSSLAHEEGQLKQTIERLRAEMPQLQSNVAAIQRELEKSSKTSDRSTANDELSNVRKEIASLMQQLESLKAANRIVYNTAPNENKTAWLVDLLDDSIRVAKPGDKDSLQRFEDRQNRSGMEQFLAWASSREPKSDYFVLLVRPNSLTMYRKLYERLNDLDFAIGVDLLERDATLIDLSEVGAVKQ